MFNRVTVLLVGVIFAFSLVSCTTSQKKSAELEIQGLKCQVSALESQVLLKDQGIESLKGSLTKAEEKNNSQNSPGNTIWEFNMLMSFIIGTITGFLASFLMQWYYEKATRPELMIGLDPDDLRNPGGCHLRVSNRPGLWPFATRKPAWNTRATIDVFNNNGEDRAIAEAIQARWARSPEPLLQIGAGNFIADLSRIFLGRQTNIFANDPQQLDVAIKYNNDNRCYIWSNESYLSGGMGGRRTEWELDQGLYRLVIRVFYETSTLERIFLLHNDGMANNSIRITELVL